MNIILIGYRATGKSSVGELLARRLDLPVVDTDQLIEERAGKSIVRIFAEDGEPAFRDLEEAIVAELLRQNGGMILSTGGGVPLRESSRKRLKAGGIVFWLTASRETIYYRMNQDESNDSRRPRLTDLTPLVEIETVLEKRNPLYLATARFVIPTDEKSTEEIADEIIDKFSQERGA